MIVLLYAALLGEIFGHFLHLDADSTMKACSIISFTNPYLFIDSTKQLDMLFPTPDVFHNS